MKLTVLFISFCLYFVSASAHQRKEDSDMTAAVKEHGDEKVAHTIDQADRELSGYGYSGEYDDGEDYGDYEDYGDNGDNGYEYGYTRGYRNNGGYHNGNGGYRNGGNGYHNDNGGYRYSYRNNVRPSRTVYRHYGGY